MKNQDFLIDKLEQVRNRSGAKQPDLTQDLHAIASALIYLVRNTPEKTT